MAAPVAHPSALGTRDDPHAQAREARRQPLLLHSMRLFQEIFERIFACREIRSVVEIGVESGDVSSLYTRLGAVKVFCVEPAPTEELRTALAADDSLHLVEKSSPDVLPELPVADLYVIDGDHNYATVRQELDWVLKHAPDSVVVLHDLLWPCARRDLYYGTSPVAGAGRHPASVDGPTVWHDGLTPAGFVGAGAFTFAQHAGGEGNGVLTAVEDALAQSTDGDWHCALVPAVFGMGVVFRKTSPADARLAADLATYSESRLLAALENNRIALYTRVLELQHEVAGHAEQADALADKVATQRHEIERLTAELLGLTSTAPGQEQGVPPTRRGIRATAGRLARRLRRVTSLRFAAAPRSRRKGSRASRP